MKPDHGSFDASRALPVFTDEARAAFATSYPEQPHKLTHRLGDHPLMALDALATLAEALPAASVEYNRADLPVGLNGAKAEGNGLGIGDTIRNIASTGSWAALKNIEQVPAYGELLASLLEELRPTIEARTGAMLKPQGFVFVTSPDGVTPYHFDPEHNILLHLMGSKVMTMFPAGDAFYAPDETHETYHTGGGRELYWRDELAAGGANGRYPRRGAVRAGDGAAFRAQRPRAFGIAIDNLAFGMELCRSRCAGLQRTAAQEWPESPRPAGGPQATGPKLSAGAFMPRQRVCVDVNGRLAHGSAMNDASPAPQLSGEELVSGLLRLLDVDDLGGDRFLGSRKPGGVGRVFGGQVIGQALAAAERTVPEDRPVHSLHAYFLRGGNEDYEIDFRVERDLDGGSFSNRRIVASQLGKPILTMLASFHRRSRRTPCECDARRPRARGTGQRA
jgi:hypothetical protein